jgi:hypothetical protein
VLAIDSSPVVRAGDRRCNRSIIRSRATRHIKRLRFEHSSPDIGHAPRIALSRCSATDSDLRGLARRWVLPSVRRATLLGFTSALRRLAPASGERSSLIARAHMPFVQSLAPICFRRVLRFPDGRKEPRAIGLASGLCSRLRSVSRSDCEARREIVPALGFASCRVCGHFPACIRTGSTPSGSPNPKGRDASDLTDRHARTLHPLMGFHSRLSRATNVPSAYSRA